MICGGLIMFFFVTMKYALVKSNECQGMPEDCVLRLGPPALKHDIDSIIRSQILQELTLTEKKPNC